MRRIDRNKIDSKANEHKQKPSTHYMLKTLALKWYSPILGGRERNRGWIWKTHRESSLTLNCEEGLLAYMNFLAQKVHHFKYRPGNQGTCKTKKLTCSLWPWGKYTTRLPIAGRETRGPAHACQSSEFRHLLSPAVSISIKTIEA